MAKQGYVQLLNDFWMNEKVQELRVTCPSAVGLYAMLLAFCSDNLTDGHVTERQLLYVVKATDEEIDALYEMGMVEPDGDKGFLIHNYLKHNRSKDQVLNAREHNVERVRRYRSRRNLLPVSDWIGGNPACLDAVRDDYPNLDLMDALASFKRKWDGSDPRSADGWRQLFEGWCQRRTVMGGIPSRKPHRHTWACEHTVGRLGLGSSDQITDVDAAMRIADELNKEVE